ncbi:MAG: ferredoxin--NADP reductase [Actinobacteria bacterium]|nr:ferredoxin--NADP reductase [Actinomycetota bacterium]
MGQPITVSATPIGDVAVFSLDRSLTGQDGHRFDGPPPDPEDPPSLLAARLFDNDPAIVGVHVLSNVVTVTRVDGWDDGVLEEAADVISGLFIVYRPEIPEDHDEGLRQSHYNATISWIREHNPDLWVLRIRPDEPLEPFKAGQYTTLALGYWEPRVDDVSEDFDVHPEQQDKMARRSYSVSSSIVDDDGELVPAHPEEVEFYIVLVRPGEVELPALTPRLFGKRVWDRLFMSRKFTGRYTLDNVRPDDNVVFLSTGTGEAPQNKMTAELLRTGHRGKVLNVVCVRYRADLAYTEQQRVVVERYANYRYVTLTTREPENVGQKVYIQDMILSGDLETELGSPLDPETTHVYLCGNPAMIGLPKWDDDGTMTFPETLGVCQIMAERGFTIDHLKTRGNVHYEEYWKDR